MCEGPPLKSYSASKLDLDSLLLLPTHIVIVTTIVIFVVITTMVIVVITTIANFIATIILIAWKEPPCLEPQSPKALPHAGEPNTQPRSSRYVVHCRSLKQIRRFFGFVAPKP